MHVDVAIIGGGPAGSTCGTLLKKHNPHLNVLLLEREKMPREHVGESLLPAVCRVLDEIGAWDKVEAANFPIKIGATYRWGRTRDFWDFEFLPGTTFQDEPRPGKYEGQRTRTAFQVDRSIYDKILLDHSREMGVDVREETKVAEIKTNGDKITSLVTEDGQKITANFYVDASGNSALLRRTMGIDVEAPSALRNIAIWDYWQNAEWAVKIGVGGTRIIVMSLGYGWIWFIPLSPTRTSIGLVVPAAYYKASGKRPEELYHAALKEEPLISSLTANATCENLRLTTNDWSYLANQIAGGNWYLAGDACGFADPILSAGMTLAMMGARHVAFSILEEMRGGDGKWLRETYNDRHRQRIRQHIQFADYWYTANAQFSELVEYTSEIAKTAGLQLKPDDAWQWLGTGGFSHEEASLPVVGGFTVPGVKQFTQRMTGEKATWAVSKFNVFQLDLEGARSDRIGVPHEGRIHPVECYRKDNRILPKHGMFGLLADCLKERLTIEELKRSLRFRIRQNVDKEGVEDVMFAAMATLESLVGEGWIKGEYDPNIPLSPMETPEESEGLHANEDVVVPA